MDKKILTTKEEILDFAATLLPERSEEDLEHELSAELTMVEEYGMSVTTEEVRESLRETLFLEEEDQRFSRGEEGEE